MKYLLILLTSFTAVNHLLAAQNFASRQKIITDFGNGDNAEFKACLRGYNLRPPFSPRPGDSNVGNIRGDVNPRAIESIKQYYPNNYPAAPDANWPIKWQFSNQMQNAALYGYLYAGCSNQRGHRNIRPFCGWLSEKGYHGPAMLGCDPMVSSGEYGWKHDPGCMPGATDGNYHVCADRFAQ